MIWAGLNKLLKPQLRFIEAFLNPTTRASVLEALHNPRISSVYHPRESTSKYYVSTFTVDLSIVYYSCVNPTPVVLISYSNTPANVS